MPNVIHKTSHVGLGKISDSDIDIIKSAVPFYLIMEEGEKIQPVPEASNTEEWEEKIKILDLPFKTIFIETSLGRIPLRGELETEKDMVLLGMFVHESSPGNLSFSPFMRLKGVMELFSSIENIEDPDTRELWDVCYIITKYLLNRLDQDEIGTVNPRLSANIKKSYGKESYRINNCVIVKPKSIQESSISLGNQIDWSHRWRVRGHWRHIPGRIGKDREGNIQKDYTWVSDHVRGPEHLPIIGKTVIVKSHPDTP